MSSGQTSQRIIFFGTEEFSAASLRALIENNFNVVAVVTKPDRKKNRGHKLIPPTVKVIAKEHNIPVWQPATLSEIAEDIQTLQPVTGVLVSFGKIIPQSIIDLFTPAIVNVHPSKLPKYRGPSPIESAILHGDTETGVSIMQLSAAMDAGPVYSFISHPLAGTETQPELYETLSEVGARELVRVLRQIISGELQPTPQDDSKATYCQLIQKSDGIIDWNEKAEIVETRIRARTAWPKSRTTLGTIEVIITKAEVLRNINYGDPGTITVLDGDLIVDAGFESLRILALQPLGKKEMPVQAFLAGYKDKLQST